MSPNAMSDSMCAYSRPPRTAYKQQCRGYPLSIEQRSSACKMVRTLVQLMRTLDQMPGERTILMKLLYFDDVTIPNILGFSFGVVQMVLYIIYRDVMVLKEELKLPEQMAATAKLGEIVVDLQVASEEIAVKGERKVKEETGNGVEMCPV